MDFWSFTKKLVARNVEIFLNAPKIKHLTRQIEIEYRFLNKLLVQ